MEIEFVQIEKLKHAEYNPRNISKQDFEQLKKSIEKFGWKQPLVVNDFPERYGVIIGGNQRFEVAKALGMKEVPVVFATISDLEEEKELNIRMNRNIGEWNFDALANNFEPEQLIDWGFTEDEIDWHPEETNLSTTNGAKKLREIKCPSCGEMIDLTIKT